MDIMVNLFRTQYELILEKMKLIDKIPRLGGTGKIFDVMEFEHLGVLYRTYSPGNWDEADEFLLYVAFDEINEPIEFFEAKFAKEIEDDKKKEAAKKLYDENIKLLAEQQKRYEKGLNKINEEIAMRQVVSDSYNNSKQFYGTMGNGTTFITTGASLLEKYIKENGTK